MSVSPSEKDPGPIERTLASGDELVNSDPDHRPGDSGMSSVRLNRALTAAPALFMIVLSGAVLLGTADLRMWRGITPGPRFFPVLLAATGVTLGVLL